MPAARTGSPFRAGRGRVDAHGLDRGRDVHPLRGFLRTDAVALALLPLAAHGQVRTPVPIGISAARQVTGSLTVQAGQARHLEVWFVAEDGDRFQPDGVEHTLGWTVSNEAVAVIDAHGDHMDLDGVAAGSTTVVFSILHGNHSDYDSPAIPITVTP